jgi:outer membrane protein OmpA-like peptidoglycan-associated protein
MRFRRLLLLAALGGAGLSSLVAQEDLPGLIKAGADFEQRQEWIKATEAYTKATVAYPTQATAFERLGDLYRRNGVFSRAVENYRKALALDSGNEQLGAILRLSELAAREQTAGVVQASTFRDLADAVRTVKPETVKAEGAEAETIPVHINFRRNKYLIGDLEEAARHQLDEVATLLTSPEWRDRMPVAIEGHTCSCGGDAVNIALGRKRAQAVLEYLVANKALRPGDGSVVSMGKSNPVVAPDKENLSAEACALDEAHNQNRRVIIREARSSVAPLVTFWYKPAGNEELRPLTDGSVLYVKDEVRVKVQAHTPLYAYLVHHGPDNAWEVLYPRKGSSDAALLKPDAAKDGYWIPGGESGFPVKGKFGDEEALVYLSAAPISEFEGPDKAGNSPAKGRQGGQSTGKSDGTQRGPVDSGARDDRTMVGIPITHVRGLAAAGAIKLQGPPRIATATAAVKFKTHD